jgi:hypothetical protein
MFLLIAPSSRFTADTRPKHDCRSDRTDLREEDRMSQQDETIPAKADGKESDPVDAHPFLKLWQTRDLDAWADALTPDVTIHSPIFTAASLFSGRETAIDLYSVLFDALPGLKITSELHDGNLSVFSWHAEIRGKDVEGADFVRRDEHGKVCEIKVMIRPLVGVAAFAKAIGPPVAAKRGKFRGPVVHVLTIPLPTLFTVIDKIASLILKAHNRPR